MKLLEDHNQVLKAKEMEAIKSKKFGSPTSGDMHQNSVLSGVSVMFENDEMVADQVLPVVSVQKDSDVYYKYTRNWRLPKNSGKRAPGAEAAQVEWGLTTSTYTCEEYALKDFVTEKQRDNADTPLNPQVDTTEAVTKLVMLLREKRVADVVTNSSNYTNNSSLGGTDQWSDSDDSDPIGDVRTAMNTVHKASGKTPNVMVVGKEVHNKLLDHPDILDRIKYSQRGVVNEDILAQVFDIDQYIVAKALYDSSEESASESLAYIWGKNVALLYVEPSPGLKKVSFGYQFQSRGFRTRMWREDETKNDWIEVEEKRDEHIISGDCGYLYQTVVA